MDVRSARTRMSRPAAHRRKRARAGLALVGLFLLILLAAAGLWILQSPWVELFRSRSALVTQLEAWGAAAPLLLIGLQVLQVVAAPIPGHLLAVAAGYLFGPWKGTLYTVIGVGAGSALLLGLARYGGRPLLTRWLSARALQRIDGWAARAGPLFFFLVLLLPFLPDDLACLAIGLSPLPWAPMLGLIVLGRLPGHFLSAWLGATADRVPWRVWLVVGAVIVLLLTLYLAHRRRIESYILTRIAGRAGGGASAQQTNGQGE
ncbi:MAG: TVP38/TMEM64 family protein [Candidatus Eisenbacteria bacterium]|nr:TVP38/TMEM64 family protein [Candidatus Eisenbacteria bacterium]